VTDELVLRPVERPRTHEVILRQVEELLTTGRLRPGDRLPPERTLAEQLGVSRPSVREALKVLEALGVVETTGGQGRDSGAVVVARPGTAIGTAMRIHVATEGLPIADLVDTRALLESAAVRRLGQRVGSEREGAGLLTPAEELLAAMKDPALTPQEFHHLDTAFHLALAEAAGNVVVHVVMSSLREAIEGYVLDAVPRLPDWRTTSAGLRRQHAAILSALRVGDGDQAAVVVDRHIRQFFARTR
jgi:GntR family transcriptional regulator, transcriptional repressor for pyruvate dehydrogenase complex